MARPARAWRGATAASAAGAVGDDMALPGGEKRSILSKMPARLKARAESGAREALIYVASDGRLAAAGTQRPEFTQR
ncbi:hypothetical protein GCM10009016_36150 [Halomonas beimenensis]